MPESLINFDSIITDERYKEVIDHLNDCFGTMISIEQIKWCNLSSNLLFEIADGGFEDTCVREKLIKTISIKLVGEIFPCFGESKIVSDAFFKKAMGIIFPLDEVK